jgi:hypothetical protein
MRSVYNAHNIVLDNEYYTFMAVLRAVFFFYLWLFGLWSEYPTPPQKEFAFHNFVWMYFVQK